MTRSSPGSDLTRRLEDAVRKAKVRREWSIEYMTLYEKMQIERDEGRKEGRKEGSSERAREIAVKMIRANEPDDKIIAYTGLSASEISEIRKSTDLI